MSNRKEMKNNLGKTHKFKKVGEKQCVGLVITYNYPEICTLNNTHDTFHRVGP